MQPLNDVPMCPQGAWAYSLLSLLTRQAGLGKLRPGAYWSQDSTRVSYQHSLHRSTPGTLQPRSGPLLGSQVSGNTCKVSPLSLLPGSGCPPPCSAERQQVLKCLSVLMSVAPDEKEGLVNKGVPVPAPTSWDLPVGIRRTRVRPGVLPGCQGRAACAWRRDKVMTLSELQAFVTDI